MNKQQFATLAIAIKSAYPASKVMEDNASMDFWYLMLKDIDYRVAENAIMEHVSTNIYPPSIAEIRKLCMERCKRPALSFDEAWGTVQRAISKYGSYHPDEAFATMDEMTLSVVKNLGWTKLCQSENPEASRANFRKAYEEKLNSAMTQIRLPDFVLKNKLALQEHYIPALKENPRPKIEAKEQEHDVRDDMTPEELEARSVRFEEMRRRILGGN